MSNNDLWCPKCKSHHHPVECPLDASTQPGAKAMEEAEKLIRKHWDAGHWEPLLEPVASSLAARDRVLKEKDEKIKSLEDVIGTALFLIAVAELERKQEQR